MRRPCSGASASSSRAANSNPPAVILSMRPRILPPAAPETYAATASISAARQLAGECRHDTLPVRHAVGHERRGRLRRVEARTDRAGRSGVRERVAAGAPSRGEDRLAPRDVGRCGGLGGGVVGALDEDGHQEERRRAGDRHPPVRLARVAEVEEETRPRADRHQRRRARARRGRRRRRTGSAPRASSGAPGG